MALAIRPARADDAAAFLAIYAPLVRETTISFELEPPDEAEMAARIERTSADFPWLVAEDERGVAGYVYCTSWRARPAYARTCEAALYVDAERRGAGVGRALMEALLPELARRGFHQVIAGVALPNEPSEGILRSLGFERVGAFREVGHKLGRAVDVAFWQRRP